MNVLAEMGIVQWRCRPDKPAHDSEAVAVSVQAMSTNSSQMPDDVYSLDSSFDSNSLNQSGIPPQDTSATAPNGFSGSLRGALEQSIANKKRAANTSKDSQSTPNKGQTISAQKEESQQSVTPNSAVVSEPDIESMSVAAQVSSGSDESAGNNNSSANQSSPLGQVTPSDDAPQSNIKSLSTKTLNTNKKPSSDKEPSTQPSPITEQIDEIKPLDISSLLPPEDDTAGTEEAINYEMSSASVSEDESAMFYAQEPLTAEPAGRDLSSLDWPMLQSMIETNEHCPSCGLGNVHLGSGNQSADWMFIIDVPNSREITAQQLFAGRAGQLFDAMLLAIGLDRKVVYTSSVFKCAPTKDLHISSQCDELIHQQIKLIAPKVVVTLGELAAQAIIKSNSPLDALRMGDQRCFRSQTQIVPTVSPAQMLDDPRLKVNAWDDLKKAMNIVKTGI